MEYLVPPWKHQLEAIERAKALPHYGLFFEMGAGKTSTTINILRHKFNEGRRVMRTLIFCPPIVIPNWKDEWRMHSKMDPGKIVLLTGSQKHRVDKFLRHAYTEESEDGVFDGVAQGAIFVTNYEALLMKDLYAAMRIWQPECVVFDESHKCKNPTATRTKLADDLVNGEFEKKTGKVIHPPVPFRYILSGSPVLNSPMDLFAQFLLLDGGETFGRNFFAFRARYFRDKNAGMPKHKYFPNWQIMPGSLDKMNALIFKKAMRVEKKDCLDLPPMVRQTIKVGMTPAQAKLYKEMKRDLITFLGENQTVVATLAITKALRLMQIASGYVKTVEGDEISLEKTPKMEALKELLEELTPHSKVLVWAVWRENYAQIRKVCEELGVEYVEVHGDVSPKAKADSVERFKTDPTARVLIGHPGSGGIGINLVVAPYSIFYSRTFSLEHSLQAEARNHRGGSEVHEKITRIDLVCEETIDELATEKLANKIEISDRLLRDLATELEKQAE
jgi:SNF2 family DNA or RNA helicase